MAIKIGKRAIWRVNGYDIPVIVRSYAGEKCGVNYYFVSEESSTVMTGVPETQLIQQMDPAEKLSSKDILDSIKNLFNK